MQKWKLKVYVDSVEKGVSKWPTTTYSDNEKYVIVVVLE